MKTISNKEILTALKEEGLFGTFAQAVGVEQLTDVILEKEGSMEEAKETIIGFVEGCLGDEAVERDFCQDILDLIDRETAEVLDYEY